MKLDTNIRRKITRALILKTKTPEILIVDDNPFNVHSLSLLIEELFKLKCDFAYSGREGIN